MDRTLGTLARVVVVAATAIFSSGCGGTKTIVVPAPQAPVPAVPAPIAPVPPVPVPPTPVVTGVVTPGKVPYEEAKARVLDAYYEGYEIGFEEGRPDLSPAERRRRQMQRRREQILEFRDLRRELIQKLLQERYAPRLAELKKAWADANPGKTLACESTAPSPVPTVSDKQPIDGPVPPQVAPLPPMPDLECWKALCPAVAEIIDEPTPMGGRPRRPRGGSWLRGPHGQPEVPAGPWMVSCPEEGEIDLAAKGIAVENREYEAAELEALIAKARAVGVTDGIKAFEEFQAARKARMAAWRERMKARMARHLEHRLVRRLDSAVKTCKSNVVGPECNGVKVACPTAGLPDGK